jgi:hypothetical protein
MEVVSHGQLIQAETSLQAHIRNSIEQTALWKKYRTLLEAIERQDEKAKVMAAVARKDSVSTPATPAADGCGGGGGGGGGEKKTPPKKDLGVTGKTKKRIRMKKRAQTLKYEKEVSGEKTQPNNDAVLFADDVLPQYTPEVGSVGRVAKRRIRMEKRAMLSEFHGLEEKDNISGEESHLNNEAVTFAGGGGERTTTPRTPRIEGKKQEKKDLGVTSKTKKRVRMKKRVQSSEYSQEKKDDISGEESQPNNEVMSFADGVAPPATPTTRGGEQKSQRKAKQTKDVGVSQKKVRVEKRAHSSRHGQEKKDDIPGEESKLNKEAVQFADGAVPPATPAECGGERKIFSWSDVRCD